MRRINDIFAHQFFPTGLIFAIAWMLDACPVGEINHQGKQPRKKNQIVPHNQDILIHARK